jgi:ribosomal protein S20
VAPLMADHTTGAGEPGRRSGVKARLTPNRRRRRVENDEHAAFVRRAIRAYARRVAAGDVDALADMTGLATELDEAIAQAVLGLREAGYSWADIAARLGVSRQAAQQRWGQQR